MAVRLSVGLALMIGLVLGGLQPVAAQDAGTLTIHQRLCGANYDGGDPYDECHDSVVGTSYEFSVTSGDDLNENWTTQATDPTTGNVSFVVTGDTALISDGYQADFDFTSRESYCSVTSTGEALNTRPVGMGTGAALEVDFPSGSDVTCDWYVFSDDAGTDVNAATDAGTQPAPSSGDTGEASSATTLPSTGVGMAPERAPSFWLLIAAALGIGGLGVVVRRRPTR
jgi:hypothetical protein